MINNENQPLTQTIPTAHVRSPSNIAMEDRNIANSIRADLAIENKNLLFSTDRVSHPLTGRFDKIVYRPRPEYREVM